MWGKRLRFVKVIGAVVLCALCSMWVLAQADTSKNPSPSGNAVPATNESAKIDDLERRMDQRFNQLQHETEVQNQYHDTSTYHFLVFAGLLMTLATLFVIGITLFTGFSASSARNEFKERITEFRDDIKNARDAFREDINSAKNDFSNHMNRLEDTFNKSLSDHNDQFQRELGSFKEEVGKQKESTVKLENLGAEMRAQFDDMKKDFDQMKDKFKPAKEIINNVHSQFEKPEVLKREALLEVVTLLLNNPQISEEYRQQLQNEFNRLSSSGEVAPASS